MPRYIDLDKVKITGEMFLDDDDEALIPLSYIRRALLTAPVEDVAPRSELERWRDMYYRANAERIASKNDYGIGEPCHQVLEDACKAARRAYEIGKYESVFLKKEENQT